MALHLVGFAANRVALHRGARSRGYKLLREGAGPKSLERWWFRLSSRCCLLAVVASLPPLL
jgi:hypothetical protein